MSTSQLYVGLAVGDCSNNYTPFYNYNYMQLDENFSITIIIILTNYN